MGRGCGSALTPWLPLRQAALFVEAGVDKVRLTGGEPTLRRDLPALVGRLAALPGLRGVGITTNGIALARQLPELRAAGAHALGSTLQRGRGGCRSVHGFSHARCTGML